MLKRTFLAAGVLLASANLLAQTDIRQGLVAYWPLNEVQDLGTGTYTTPDLVSGQDFDLINMDPTASVPGQRGNALVFDGLTQHAVRFHDLAANTGLPISRNPQFTIAMWIKATLPRVADRRIFSEANHIVGNIANNRNPLFNLGTDNRAGSPSGALNVFIRNDTGGLLRDHTRTVAEPNDGNWHHIAFTDNNGAVQVFVDGVPDPTVFNYTRGALTVLNTSLAAIQRDIIGSWWAGTIDDVALFERILTQAEIQEIMNNGIVTPIPPLPAYFSQQPVATVDTQLGHRFTLSGTAVGTRPVTYQWFRGENPIDGATSQTLTINNVLASDAGQYRLRATTAGGDTFSSTTTVTVAADPAPDVRNGLLSYWPLNTGTTTTPDLYSGNDFQLVNMDASNFIAGQRGQALTFNAEIGGTENEYAFRTSGSPIYLSPNHTVSFWVRAQPQGDIRAFAEGSTTGNNPLYGFGTFNNLPGLDVYIRNDDGGNPVNHRTGQRPVFDGTWHHVAWVDANGAARLYIDGVLDPVDFTYTRGTMTPNTTALATLLRAGPNGRWMGDLDEVATWSRALTYTEIQEIFNNGVPAPVAIIPAAISLNPIGADLYQGDRIVLTADATGTAPLAFQWLKNGDPIPGATGKTLLLSNVQPGDTGSYTFRASNAAPDAAVSNPAIVNVTAVTGLGTGLVSYWPLDVLAGETTLTTPDVVNGNDLTAYNLTAANLVEGKVGMAVSFPPGGGNNEILGRNHVATPSVGLPISNHRALTVTMWVNGIDPIDENDRRVFAEASNTSNNPLFNIGTDSANNTTTSLPWLDIYIRNLNNTAPVSHRKTTLPAFDGDWHHVAYVDNNGIVNIYIDGVLEPTTDFNYTRGVVGANTTSIGGILRAGPITTFTGLVDDVAVWGRALTQVEVLNVLANGPQAGGGGGSANIGGITLSGGTLRIAVNTDIDAANLKVQFITAVDASNWTDVQNVTWSVEGNQKIATFTAPADDTFYRIVGAAVQPPAAATVIYSDNFEGAASAWTSTGVGNTWERGQPTLGPGLAFSGSGAFVTDLDAPYAPNSIQQLRSPVIDLAGVTSGRISWMEARDVEGPGDLAEVIIRDADNPEAFIAQVATNNGTRAAWNLRSVPIPAEALGRRIILEFSLTTDGANTAPRFGWMIDDVQVIKTN